MGNFGGWGEGAEHGVFGGGEDFDHHVGEGDEYHGHDDHHFEGFAAGGGGVPGGGAPALPEGGEGAAHFAGEGDGLGLEGAAGVKRAEHVPADAAIAGASERGALRPFGAAPAESAHGKHLAATATAFTTETRSTQRIGSGDSPHSYSTAYFVFRGGGR